MSRSLALRAISSYVVASILILHVLVTSASVNMHDLAP